MILSGLYEGLQNLDDPTVNLLLVMLLIWSSGVLFRKIRQPPMLGELLGGFIFGPSVLGIINPDMTLEVLSHLGVFFLMFYAGLETNPDSLKKMGKQAFLVGAGGFFAEGILTNIPRLLYFYGYHLEWKSWYYDEYPRDKGNVAIIGGFGNFCNNTLHPMQYYLLKRGYT